VKWKLIFYVQGVQLKAELALSVHYHFVLYRAFLIAGLRVVLRAISLLHGRDDGRRSAVLSLEVPAFKRTII
jgi:hypothetical protein